MNRTAASETATNSSFFACVALLTLLSLLPSAWIMAAEQASFTRYFSVLPFRETPFDPLVGIHSLTEAQAKRRNHFRFDYDTQGRPIRVRFMLGDTVRELNDTASNYFYTPHMEITYDGDTETRTFHDRRGNRVVSNGGVYVEKYTLDEQGYRSALHFFDVDGAPVQNAWGVARYEWAMLGNGDVIEKRYSLSGEQVEIRPGFPFYELRLSYGPAGWLKLMQNMGLGGELTTNDLNAAQDRLDMNVHGDFLSWNVLGVDGKLVRGNAPNVARGIMERDEFGYEVAERYEDENGQAIESAHGWAYTRSTYDRFGNRIERRNYTLDGKQLADSSRFGFAITRTTFDERGLIPREARFFDAAGKPATIQNLGHHRVVFTHDDSNDLVAVQYEDAAGRLIERQDSGIARIELDRDRFGRVIEQRYLDVAGHLTEHKALGVAIERRTYADTGVAVQIERLRASGEPIQEPSP